MASELRLERLTKIYNPRSRKAVLAVKTFDLRVAPGEIVALLGSSGCGKTSTLRMIAGFEDVTSGEILLDGQPIQHLPPAGRGVAMAFEAYSLYPPLTIGDNMAFALKSQRLPVSETSARVRDMAAMLEIADVLNKYPSSVSGGQQQRASLGRALVRKARLTLLDEPMGQLEPQLRALLRGRIKHYLRENSLTSILVTHDQTEANALADRIAVMEAGELQQYATPQELKDHPANLFTATFIGEPPMNVLPAIVRRNDPRVGFVIGEHSDLFLDFGADEFETELLEDLFRRADVVLGIRPHALRLANQGMQATVMSCQWLGDQTHVAVELGGRTVVLVSHEYLSLETAASVRLQFDPRELHIFDSQSGLALSHGGRVA
jgi:multiple sugar transport system ATP-binding protein